MSAAEILEAIRAMSLAERREIVGEILAEIQEPKPELSANQPAEPVWQSQESAPRSDDLVSWSDLNAGTAAKFAQRP